MGTVVEIVQGLGGLFISLIGLYIWVFIITALLSFVNPDPYNPIVQFLYRITNPAYVLVRKFMRTNFNGLDLAPLVVIIFLQVLIVVLRAFLNSLY